jgi:hypothetical protein
LATRVAANFKETAPEGFLSTHALSPTHPGLSLSPSPRPSASNTRAEVPAGGGVPPELRVLAMGGRHYVELFRVQAFFPRTIVSPSHRFVIEALTEEPLLVFSLSLSLSLTHHHTHTHTYAWFSTSW